MTAWGAKRDDPDLSSAMATPMLAMAGSGAHKKCRKGESSGRGFLPIKVLARNVDEPEKDVGRNGSESRLIAHSNEPNREPSGHKLTQRASRSPDNRTFLNSYPTSPPVLQPGV